ncbi:excinuclease ABC subunit B [Candidatus Wolfebacteria bacterium RIFCSPLOWO2_01_FULL_38_11]|uniref:UvrABC system protein B n=2 Tax=Candidatus Wolfeibacteriota TaxID=1752735 RepID=A0A0G0J584_9BACT|nr:MAG: UvrABC system protein B [Candidatus Wolfebacteria bacterium GW2011_GWC1_37_10]OGM90361.1 MAG: excinuclease ABC subunit B [Candidatus Wolfebacteria bacterium RIFCSPLOWO2_01_FULL_38_11]
MSLFKLKSKFKPSGDQPQAIKKLIAGLEKSDRFQTLLGVTGSGKTFTMANVIAHFNMPVLVMAPNKTLAAQLYREYKNFFPQNSVNYFVSYYDYYQPEAYLPTSDTYIEKEAMINEEIDRLRHQATSALLSRRDVIVVASVSCIYNLGVPVSYSEAALHLEENKDMTRGDLIRQLVKMQFERTGGALKRGFFRVRGDVFEIMPASGAVINRIEIKEQKIISIADVDPISQKIIQELKDIVIFPPKHFISSQPQIESATKEIKKELKERLQYFEKNKLYLEAERLERRTRYDMEMLQSIGYCHGIENYSRHLSGKISGESPDTLLSYFPSARRSPGEEGHPDFLTIIDESHIAVPQVKGMYEGDRSRKEVLIQYGWRLPSALDNRPLKFEEFEKRINQVIFTSATPGAYEMKNSSKIVEQVIRPTGLIDPPIEVRPVFNKQKNRSQIDDLMEEIKKVVSKKERAIINTLTKKMAEDLTDYLKKKKFKANYMHSETKTLERVKILTDFRSGKFDVLIGVNLLREGLDLPEVTFVAILDADREGFLRSESSIIQTMGRAARNVNGKVILYADNITGSMKRAIDEVERRRKIQAEYNKKHNITPQSIHKEIEKLIEIENEKE